MIVNNLSAINKNIDARERNRKLRKWLPVFLILSFVWLCLFETISSSNFELFDYLRLEIEIDATTLTIVSVITTCLIEWLWFEVVLYAFKLLTSFSVFCYTVPKALLENRARTFMIIRNLVLGIFYNLLFFFPYLINLILIFELIVYFTVFAFFFKSATRETVSVMIIPNVLRAYFNAFAFIEFVHVAIYVVGVL